MHIVSVCLHSARKVLSYGEKIAKIGPVHPEIFDKIRRTTTWTRNAISIRLYSTETTGPIFTKILHDIMALVALLHHAYMYICVYTRRYPNSFLNSRATKVRSLPFFHKVGCRDNVPWAIEKSGTDRVDHLHPKRFHSVKRLRKSVQRILR